MGVRRPTVVRSRAELSEALAAHRATEGGVALVPTMGALHEGHLVLFDRAASLASCVVASVFVNPLQFGSGEDLDRYPRDLDRDVDLAGAHGVSLVFAPEAREMFFDGEPRVRVSPGVMGDRLCGRFRPGHFEGVLTVVAKLFGIVRPAVAVFGRKDLQQAALIRRMVSDLELGVEIDVIPLVRGEDGLALSSRNAYLSPAERSQALGFVRALTEADEAFRGGLSDPEGLLARVREVVAEHPSLVLQYSEIVDADTLDAVEAVRAGSVIALAGFVGSTRLIDNLVLGAERADPQVGSHA
ncbi:MAG: pantoate--beta-alanine ligase [Gemmatimonadota bacterium]